MRVLWRGRAVGGVVSAKFETLCLAGFLAFAASGPLVGVAASGHWPRWLIAPFTLIGLGGFALWMVWIGRRKKPDEAFGPMVYRLEDHGGIWAIATDDLLTAMNGAPPKMRVSAFAKIVRDYMVQFESHQ